MLLTLEMFWAWLSPEWAEQVTKDLHYFPAAWSCPFLSELAIFTEIVSDDRYYYIKSSRLFFDNSAGHYVWIKVTMFG